MRIQSRRLRIMKITCAVDEIRGLTADEIKAILDKDKRGEFLLLDVRQPEEYETGHILGATLIPLGELEARQGELDRNKKIIAYCRSGRRSMAAAIALCGLGFEGVHNLDGGILDWPYETITGIPERRPDLVTGAADTRDVIMLAIKLEKGSRDFYLVARDTVKSPQVKEIFQTLANTENSHMQRLYERTIGIFGKEALPPLDRLEQELKVEHMEGGIEVSLALARIDEKFTDETEGLEIAVEKEYMSYDFYKRTSTLVRNTEAKALLHKLALEERKHASKLLERLEEVVRQR
jgi:rhodanese-related sulfurtransferase/rubrerythrin